MILTSIIKFSSFIHPYIYWCAISLIQNLLKRFSDRFVFLILQRNNPSIFTWTIHSTQKKRIRFLQLLVNSTIARLTLQMLSINDEYVLYGFCSSSANLWCKAPFLFNCLPKRLQTIWIRFCWYSCWYYWIIFNIKCFVT